MNMRIFKVHQSEEGQTLEKYIQKLLMSAPSSFTYKYLEKKMSKLTVTTKTVNLNYRKMTKSQSILLKINLMIF